MSNVDFVHNSDSSDTTVSGKSVPTRVSSPASNPKLENAAHQFEATLMQELLAPLQKDSMSSPDGDSGSGDALSTFASEAMARAISDRGGFGIATKLIDHFERPGGKVG